MFTSFYSFSWLIHRLCSPAGWADAKFSACFLFFLLWARAPWKMCAPSIYPPLWDFETLVIYRSLAFPIILILFFYSFFIFSSYSPIFCFVGFLKKNPMISVLICVMFLLFGCRLSLSLSLSLSLPSLPPSPATSTSMASSHTPLQQVVVLYTAILMLLLAVVSSYMCT